MGLVRSFKYAFSGLRYILRTQRNARLELVIAVLVLALAKLLDVSSAELVALVFVIIMVFLAEIINTAFEKTLDLIDTKPNPQIKVIKDMVAGAVLVAAMASVVVG